MYAEPKAQGFVEQNTRPAWGLSKHRARPETAQKAAFLHDSPCQTFSVVMAPIFGSSKPPGPLFCLPGGAGVSKVADLNGPRQGGHGGVSRGLSKILLLW
jgi:hypothetical protein